MTWADVVAFWESMPPVAQGAAILVAFLLVIVLIEKL